MATISSKINVLLCGTGEYTTGFVHGGASKSDKKTGVVGLCVFELRRLGSVGEISMVGTNGTKFPRIREHLKANISDVYAGLDTSFRSFPADDVARDPEAYKAAIASLQPGDAVIIFTPDDTHFPIARCAIEHGCHVLLTKPAVKTLAEHQQLVHLAAAKGVHVQVEFHKRWDPIYADARARIRAMGDFAFFHSFMSQPKFQLETFAAWAGTGSDISYYLNSHHVDFHCWAMEGKARPVSVTASASTGVATAAPYNCPPGTEDSITLLTQWASTTSASTGTAVYTASWTAPKADVHSQQRFHCMGHTGEVVVDQAHRGYTVTTDAAGFASVNPLYMSYAPGPGGHFAGHFGYGYRSIAAFVEACQSVNAKHVDADALHGVLPTLQSTLLVTAIVEAGRRSLDAGGRTALA